LNRAQVIEAAGRLAEAWRTGLRLDGLPESCRPRTPAEGYRVQDALTAELGIVVGGWKVGATGAAARKLLGARGPFAGRVFAPRIFESGIALPATLYPTRGLEAEVAFTLGADLPPRKRPHTAKDVAAAVKQAHLAIEIVDLRFAKPASEVGIGCLIADEGANGALILGPAIRRWRDVDLAKVHATMRVNDAPVGEGSGAGVLGNPLNALAWLANHRRTRGGLANGAVVTTGTLTGMHRAAPGDRAVADFGRLGTVALTFLPET
jgi:2-oxo-3-hexenedioate decarboxylase/2-keto-4-pentenoate hydratase